MDFSLRHFVSQCIFDNEGNFLKTQYSYEIVRNKQLFNHVLPLYQVLLSKLIAKPSIVPLIIYKHVVISNITKIFQERTNFILL